MSERTTARIRAARRGAVEDLSPEEIASREQERQELLAHLAAQADDEQPEPEQRPYPTPEQLREFGIISAPDLVKMTPEELGLATGIGDHAKAESARATTEDEERLAQIVAGLAPFKAMVESTFDRCKVIENDWSTFLKELRSVNWSAFRHRHPRGAPLSRRITDVMNGLDEATRLIEHAHRAHDDLIGRIDGVSVGRVMIDRHYLPEIRWEVELYVTIPKGISDVLWRLRRDAVHLKESLDRLAGDTTPAPSADAVATAATASENRTLARSEIDPLPAKPDNVKMAPARVRDNEKSIF